MAMKTKRVIEVAIALIKIFTTIGPPAILHSDNGREFSNIAGQGFALSDDELGHVIDEIAGLWP